MLASHYVVDLERVSEGYCLPDKDEAALAEVQQLDAVAAGPSAVLATTFEAEIVTPRILQLNFFFSLLAKIRALPFPFLFPLAKP